MPLPIPRKKETENDFIGRCVPLVLDLEGLDKDDDKERKQAVAICYSQLRKAKGGKAMEIEDLTGVAFDVDGEDVPFEELVEAYKAMKAVTKKEKDGQHPASHYLVVEDPKKPTTWHLRVRDVSGELDHGLMGAAWAALHTGYRGNVYEGPNKQEAIAKLKRLYKREDMELPGEGKAIEIVQRMTRVQDAWRAEFSRPAVPGGERPWYNVRVFEDPDLAIVELPEGLFAYPFSEDEDEITFDEPYEVEFMIQRKEGKAIGAYSRQFDEDTDAMIALGGEIKALGGGKVGGYLVRFGNEDEKDLTGEFFTTKTYYGPADGDGVDTLVHHGLPLPHNVTDPEIKAELQQLTGRILSPMKTKRDALGIWAETVLNLADEYEKMIHGMVEKAKLKWSSRSVNPLIRKKSNGEIERWPIVEGSLTPIPAEFRGTQVMPLKSYLKSYLKAIGMDEAPKGGDNAGALCSEAAEAIARSQLLLTEIEQEQ